MEECLVSLEREEAAAQAADARLQQLVFEAMRLRAAHLRLCVTGSNDRRSHLAKCREPHAKSAADIKATLVGFVTKH